jgi:hypothetical protein
MLALNYANTCFGSVGLTLNDMIQYITDSGKNTGSSLLNDPKILQQLINCMCGTNAEKYLQYLLCYDKKCSKELKIDFLTGGGIYWKGYCLQNSGSIKSTNNHKNEWSIPEPNEEAQKLFPRVAPGKTNRVFLALELPYAVALKESTSIFQSKSWFTLAADVAVEV